VATVAGTATDVAIGPAIAIAAPLVAGAALIWWLAHD